MFFKKVIRYFTFIISALALIVVGFISYLLWFQPPFYCPKPSGQYAIGRVTYHWIDTKRKELWHDDPAHPNRELIVTIWYPAEGKLPETPTTPYAPDFVDYIKHNKKLFWLLYGFYRPLYSYAQPNTSFINDGARYPALLFSPGGGGRFDGNTVHCEELASQGYVMVGISRPYDSFVVTFPDGRIADGFKGIAQRKKDTFLAQRKQTEEEIEVWIDDSRFVLDQLEKLSETPDSMFYHRLDTNRIGAYGQSMGGSTTVQLCRRDTRVKAGVDMDGSLFGTNATERFDKPFMFMLAGKTMQMFESTPMQAQDWKKFGIRSMQEEQMFRDRYILGYEKLVGKDHNKYFLFSKILVM